MCWLLRGKPSMGSGWSSRLMARKAIGTPCPVHREARSISWACTWGSVLLPELPQLPICWPAVTADADGQRSALQVRNRGVDAVVTADGDLVADHEARPAQFPDRRLDQQVHDAEQVRACPVVASPVGCLDDRAVDHRQHGLPQTRVFLGGTHRLTTERRTRVLGGFVGEIDRVGLPVGSQPMAGDPRGGTVQGDPSAPHRRVHSARRRDRKQPRREKSEQDARHETQ